MKEQDVAKHKAEQEEPEKVKVYPSAAMIERGEHLAGIPIDGAEVDSELAAEWFENGLVTLEPEMFVGENGPERIAPASAEE